MEELKQNKVIEELTKVVFVTNLVTYWNNFYSNHCVLCDNNVVDNVVDNVDAFLLTKWKALLSCSFYDYRYSSAP